MPKNETAVKLGLFLAKLREKTGKTQQMVANAINMDASAICRIERGRHCLTVCQLQKLLSCYKLSNAEQLELARILSSNGQQKGESRDTQKQGTKVLSSAVAGN